MIYLTLFFEFFKTGLFAMGGGLATIPFLSKMGSTYGWFNQTELSNMFAISESTPGPIGINMATYVGFKVAGIKGAICSTVGEVMPAIIIIVIIARILNEFKENKYVKYSFEGIRPITLGLIISAFVSIFTSSVVFVEAYKQSGLINDLLDIKVLGIFILVLVLNKKFKVHPIVYVGLSALIGIILAL